jgi:hypothetical protein
MAQRTVRGLVAAGELMPRRNALGGQSYVLTRPGAAALEVRGVTAHHGLDLAVSGPAFRHGALTARWCIAKRAQGFQSFTEYALQQGRAPLSRELLFKRLGRHVDAVFIKGDKLYAVETESAPKDTASLMRIAAMAELVGRKLHPDAPFVLAGVFVVFDAEQNHAGRIARAARERWQRYSEADQATLAGRVTLAHVELGLPLVWRGCAEERLAHVRFETAPGLQLQVDFGSTHVLVGEEHTRIFLFVATLGYSRRTYVLLSLHERQSAWLLGLEGAFRHFGGVTHEVLVDNAKALVEEHNRQTREVKLNDRFRAFCSYWGVTPRACAPYRAQTKGKDERGVGYVKRNAIAGHKFASLDALQAHLDRWMRDVADVRVHGTTGEPPIERFERDERRALRPLPSKAPFLQVRELVRRVHTDACIELDTNRYSVPWKLIGEQVSVVVADREVQVLYAGQEVARHAQRATRSLPRRAGGWGGAAAAGQRAAPAGAGADPEARPTPVGSLQGAGGGQGRRAGHRAARRSLQPRRAAGASDTQCRLHLERLTAVEYLLVHRGKRPAKSC